MHIDESSPLDTLLHVFVDRHWIARSFAGGVKGLVVVQDWSVSWSGTVVAVDGDGLLELLDPSARFKVAGRVLAVELGGGEVNALVDSLVELVPFVPAEGAQHLADVDKIELGLECKWLAVSVLVLSGTTS